MNLKLYNILCFVTYFIIFQNKNVSCINVYFQKFKFIQNIGRKPFADIPNIYKSDINFKYKHISQAKIIIALFNPNTKS